MANEVYTLTLNSSEKSSGLNNAAVFYLSMTNLLEERWSVYNMQVVFVSESGYYKDYTTSKYGSAKLFIDMENTTGNTYDTARGVDGSFVGCVYRMHDTAALYSSTSLDTTYISAGVLFTSYATSIYKGDLVTIPARTVANASQCNKITVSLTRMDGTALTDTNVLGSANEADMGRWTMQLVFTPIA